MWQKVNTAHQSKETAAVVKPGGCSIIPGGRFSPLGTGELVRVDRKIDEGKYRAVQEENHFTFSPKCYFASVYRVKFQQNASKFVAAIRENVLEFMGYDYFYKSL